MSHIRNYFFINTKFSTQKLIDAQKNLFETKNILKYKNILFAHIILTFAMKQSQLNLMWVVFYYT